MGDKARQRGKIRASSADELAWFENNPETAGMMTKDDAVILNPYSSLSDEQLQAVATNERARLHMKHDPVKPGFALTEDQRARLGGYSPDEDDVRQTIAARIVSGDSSSGEPTPEQLDYAKDLKRRMQLGGTK